jgi:hypothetical protein
VVLPWSTCAMMAILRMDSFISSKTQIVDSDFLDTCAAGQTLTVQQLPRLVLE